MRRRAALASAALFLLALGGCGGGGSSRKSDPFSVVPQRPVTRVVKAAPRWDPLTRRSGAGNATERFSVARGAIQWRARFSCRGGRLRLLMVSAGNDRKRLGERRCPGRGKGVSISTGPQRLQVLASGPWRLTVEQQVDTPLHEPPLRAMRSPRSSLVSRGGFYPIEGRGKGTALLYRLPNGRLALRLVHFETTANSDLFVWLSTARRPKTSKQAVAAPHVEIAPLRSTLGDQNYLLPRSTNPREVKSIVIWCRPVSIAYTAAEFRG